MSGYADFEDLEDLEHSESPEGLEASEDAEDLESSEDLDGSEDLEDSENSESFEDLDINDRNRLRMLITSASSATFYDFQSALTKHVPNVTLLNCVDNHQTVLIAAVRSKVDPVTKVHALLNFAAPHLNIHYKTPDQKSAIHYAIDSGDLKLVIQLSDAGAKKITEPELEQLAQDFKGSPKHETIVARLQLISAQQASNDEESGLQLQRLPYHTHQNLILGRHQTSSAALISYTDGMKSLEFERAPVRDNWSEQQRFLLFVDYLTGFSHYGAQLKAIQDQAAQQAQEGAPETKEIQLNYANNELYGDHLLWIARGRDLKKESPVTAMIFDGNPIIQRGKFGLQQLSGIQSLFARHSLSGNLHTLSLSHCGLNDHALNSITSQLTEKSSLKRLILSNNPFTDQAVIAFKDKVVELKLNMLQVEMFGADIGENTKLILRKFSIEQLKNQNRKQLEDAINAALAADVAYQNEDTTPHEEALQKACKALSRALNLQTVWDPIHYPFHLLQADVQQWKQKFYAEQGGTPTSPVDGRLNTIFTEFERAIQAFYEQSHLLNQALIAEDITQFSELTESHNHITYTHYALHPDDEPLQDSLYHLAFERLRNHPSDAQLKRIVDRLLPTIPFDVEHPNEPGMTALQAFLQRKAEEPPRTAAEYKYQKKLLKILIRHLKEAEMGALRALWVMPPTRIETTFRTLRDDLANKFVEWDKSNQESKAGKLQTEVTKGVGGITMKASFGIKGITSIPLITGILTAASIKLEIVNPIAGVLTFAIGLLIYGAAKYAHTLMRDAILPTHWMNVPEKYIDRDARANYIAHKFVQRFGLVIENRPEQERLDLSDIFVRRLGYLYRQPVNFFRKHQARILRATNEKISIEALLDGLLSVVCDKALGSGWQPKFAKANRTLSETPIACVDPSGNIMHWHMVKSAMNELRKSRRNNIENAKNACKKALDHLNDLKKQQIDRKDNKFFNRPPKDKTVNDARENSEKTQKIYDDFQKKISVSEYQIVQHAHFSDRAYPSVDDILTADEHPVTHWWHYHQYQDSSEPNYRDHVTHVQDLRMNEQDIKIKELEETNKKLTQRMEELKATEADRLRLDGR